MLKGMLPSDLIPPQDPANQVAQTDTPAPQFTPVEQPSPPAPIYAPPKKPRNLRNIIIAAIGVVLLVVSAGGGYVFGMRNGKASNAQPKSNIVTITVPKDATVTSECVERRGKQYILPKDIPDGPIYDVHDGKVIAVEYLIGLKELTATQDQFKDLQLFGGQYDHIAVVPMDPHAGLNEQHFHVIGYLIPDSVVSTITCTNQSTTTTHTH